MNKRPPGAHEMNVTFIQTRCFFGKQAEPILEKYLRMRYELMPYIYSLGYKTWQSGAPLGARAQSSRAVTMRLLGNPTTAPVASLVASRA